MTTDKRTVAVDTLIGNLCQTCETPITGKGYPQLCETCRYEGDLEPEEWEHRNGT